MSKSWKQSFRSLSKLLKRRRRQYNKLFLKYLSQFTGTGDLEALDNMLKALRKVRCDNRYTNLAIAVPCRSCPFLSYRTEKYHDIMQLSNKPDDVGSHCLLRTMFMKAQKSNILAVDSCCFSNERHIAVLKRETSGELKYSATLLYNFGEENWKKYFNIGELLILLTQFSAAIEEIMQED